MSVYLLHFSQPISDKHTCQHYIGSVAGNSRIHLMRRISAHLQGTGARLCEVAKERNIGFILARLWKEGGRYQERKLKLRKNAPKLCPYCRGKAPGERPCLPPVLTLNNLELEIRRAELMPLSINDYPDEIALKRRALLKVEQSIRDLNKALGAFSAQIDQMVAFDKQLSNEAQRRAQRERLRQENVGYVQTLAALDEAHDVKADIEIDLELIRNQFGLLKFQERERIARIEGQLVA